LWTSSVYLIVYNVMCWTTVHGTALTSRRSVPLMVVRTPACVDCWKPHVTLAGPSGWPIVDTVKVHVGQRSRPVVKCFYRLGNEYRLKLKIVKQRLRIMYAFCAALIILLTCKINVFVLVVNDVSWFYYIFLQGFLHFLALFIS